MLTSLCLKGIVIGIYQNDSIPKYNTKSLGQIIFYILKTSQGQKSVKYRGQVLSNWLNDVIKDFPSFQNFKQNILKK